MSKPAPALTVVRGSESLLVERSVGRVVASLVDYQPDVEVLQYAGHDLTAQVLTDALSPSLFATHRAVVVLAVHECPDDVAQVLERYAAAPADDTWVVVTHSGRASDAQRVVKAFAAAGASVIDCAAPKPWQRAEFVAAEFAAAGRRISDAAAKALVDAVGTDLRELAGACAQLASDTSGSIDEAAVARYYRGRAAASGFTVGDRLLDGDVAGALGEFRWALAVGSSPVAVTGALASSLRTLIRVGAAGRDDAALADLKVPAWRVKRARQQVARWHPDDLAFAVRAVAEADAAAKGAAADATYAVERALLSITEVRERR